MTAPGRRHDVFIAGSCVSRDAFPDADEAGPWNVCAYHSRSSLATLAGEHGGLEPVTTAITSAFQRRMVEWDQTQHLLPALERTPFDVLLLDLIDERFSLLRRPDGSVITLSTEYMRCAPRPLPGTAVRGDSTARYALWKAGLDILLRRLQRKDALRKVLVSRVFWAEADAKGRPFEAFSAEQVQQANQFLARCYADLEAVLGRDAFIDYPGELLVADCDHRWGISPYHYIPALYEHTRSRLAEFVARVAAASPPPAPAATAAAPPAARRPAVSTVVDASGLVASINPVPAAGGKLFAFYLFRDDTRVAQTEYGAAPTTCFPIPSVAGSYRVAAFCKDRGTGSIERLAGPAQSLPGSAEYDTSRWRLPLRVHADAESLAPTDGIHSFHGAGPTSLDFLLQDFDRIGDAAAILVCFNGAVSQRATKVGPFFAGTSIGRRLGLPVVCVADPTLTRARDVSLAWYAGCDDQPRLPQTIARHLDAVAQATKRPLILLGGSGGAFASLSVTRHLRSPATAVACNPQTAIHRYHRQSVLRYLERGFPAVTRRLRLVQLSLAQLGPDRLREALAEAGATGDLTTAPLTDGQRAIVLQNRNDPHHVEHHLGPVVDGVGAHWQTARLATLGRDFAAWLGRWGEGHVAPPAALIDAVVTRVAAGTPVADIALDLDVRFGDGDAAAAFEGRAE